MAITVINKYKGLSQVGTGLVVYCGRGSALGNPFIMHNDKQRDYVCDLYYEYFYDQVERKVPEFVAALEGIENLARNGNVHLQCFCAPKRCHCDTIKQYVESKL